MSIHLNPEHKGLFHEDVGVKQGEPIPIKKIMGAMKSKSPAVRRRANFARMAKRHFKPLS